MLENEKPDLEQGVNNSEEETPLYEANPNATESTKFTDGARSEPTQCSPTMKHSLYFTAGCAVLLGIAGGLTWLAYEMTQGCQSGCPNFGLGK
ncbi:MAG: hypothetical protein ACK4PR_03540 [Gammaproteobacteria bacterium]